MAVLSPTQLAELRRGCAQDVAVNYTKAQVNAALQAVEDWMEATARAEIATAIELAAPGVFTGPQKKSIFRWFMRQKFERGG